MTTHESEALRALGKVPAGGLFLARENSKPWARHRDLVLTPRGKSGDTILA